MADIGTMFGAGQVETFMGLPSCTDLSLLDARIALLGASAATPYVNVGAYCAGGPSAIRAAGAAYAANLTHMNFDLGGAVFPDGVVAVDAGDLPCDPADPEGARALIGKSVGQILDRNGVPMLLGGDDSVPIPMLAAFAGRGRQYTIVQIDAHIDWRDEVQGERLGLSSTMRRASEMDHIERIIQVGARGIGSARVQDVTDAKAWGVDFVTAAELARSGPACLFELIPEGSEIIICFDCDALDPSIMPAVIGRTAGGLSYWQALGLIECAAARGRIAGFDLVEFMPERDIDGMGAMLAAQLLAAVMGIVARQPAMTV